MRGHFLTLETLPGVSENVRVPGLLLIKPQRRNHALMPQASQLLFVSQDRGLLESGNARHCLFQRPVAVAQPVTELDCAGEWLPTAWLEMPGVVEAYIREHLRR